MNAKIETQRVQRILTSTVLAAALMSSLAACGGGGGGHKSGPSAGLPGTDIPTNPTGPTGPNNPGNPGGPNNPGGPSDPNPPVNPVTTGLLQTTLGNTGKAVDNTLPLNLGTTPVSYTHLTLPTTPYV